MRYEGEKDMQGTVSLRSTDRAGAPMTEEWKNLEMENRLKYNRLWVSLGVLLVLLVIYLSLAPLRLPPVGARFPHLDKLAHFLAYGGTMLWFGQIFRTRSASSLIAAGLILLGVVLEFLQDATGYRTFDHFDMTANGIGAIAGLLLSWTRLGGFFALLERRLPGIHR